MEVHIIQTGGTIDKEYPRSILGYAFEIGSPAANRILDRIKPSNAITYSSACKKDSQDITDQDREHIVRICDQIQARRILITHGTDTLIETAAYLAKRNLKKMIILTGAFKPETMKDSDADFNVGFALGALNFITTEGVYVAMNGGIHLWNNVDRNDKNHKFGKRSSNL